MKKKLVVFLDGTWNEPTDNTNVWRLKVMLATHDANGVPQHPYYDAGVGTKWYERIRGGMAGAGLSQNIREAYQWLVEQYDDEDEVFLFGFSRGAYTARSLAGMIARCGLLLPGAAMTTQQVYDRYRRGKSATPLYDIEFARKYNKRPLVPDEERLLANSRRIPIKMIGVWDTVGALGIPWTAAPVIGRGNYYFHNTNLSVLFDHAYHALAIDEHRGPYRATLWTAFSPNGQAAKPPPGLDSVEQRWFVGAHSNVGGGYEDDQLAQIPLAWLQAKAMACGLWFRHRLALSGQEALSKARDSYAEFLKKTWRFLTLGQRSYRDIGAGPRPVRGGTSTPVNEVIDASVLARYQSLPSYRPRNLEQWAAKKKLDLANLKGDQQA